MKLNITIFAFYMLALSLIPCGDGGGGIIEWGQHLFDIEHHSDHEEHSHDCGDDACSPFCICACCSMALDTPSKTMFRVRDLQVLPETKPSFISKAILSTFHHTIWQPPKAS